MKTVKLSSGGAEITVKTPRTFDVAPNRLGPLVIVAKSKDSDGKPVYECALSDEHQKAGWELA